MNTQLQSFSEFKAKNTPTPIMKPQKNKIVDIRFSAIFVCALQFFSSNAFAALESTTSDLDASATQLSLSVKPAYFSKDAKELKDIKELVENKEQIKPEIKDANSLVMNSITLIAPATSTSAIPKAQAIQAIEDLLKTPKASFSANIRHSGDASNMNASQSTAPVLFNLHPKSEIKAENKQDNKVDNKDNKIRNNNDELPKSTLAYLNKNNFGGRANAQMQSINTTQIASLMSANAMQPHQTTNKAVNLTPANAASNNYIQLSPKTALTVTGMPPATLPNSSLAPLTKVSLASAPNTPPPSPFLQSIQNIGGKISDAGQGLIGSIQKVSDGIGQGIGQIGQTGLKIVASATQLVGIPYRFGGNTPSTGLDCSGFVRYVYQNTIGLVLPRQSAQMSQVGKSVTRDDLSIGDLVFFNTRGHAYSHVGIYVGGGRFIHSPSTGKTIRFDQMSNSYWAQRYNGARRLI